MTAENKGGILNASANVEIIKQFLEGENPENVQEPLNGTYLQSSKQISLKCKPIGKVAKKRLYAELYKEKYEEEKEKIYRRLQQQHTEIIYVPKEENPKDQSNLHLAVLNSNIEEIYCIVEIHKQYNKPFSDINIRDKLGKTALDYALKLTREQEKFTLVVDYLKENTAQQGVSLKT
ncbi:uncharacterized protein LOC129225630 [Uloborus diversus]|uniref:uncharacterized protein LOC129225630 n=1 Tax=Uloborus diversus TaxID=327109 RepID=UPI0024094BF2|nr:uncharacterized protein LOC129225630 [Uloborus diversus]